MGVVLYYGLALVAPTEHIHGTHRHKHLTFTLKVVFLGMISASKLVDCTQQFLFPELIGQEFKTEAEKRVFFGSAAEKITNAALKGTKRIRIDGKADICPDLVLVDPSGGKKGYIEVKSCGKSNQFIVYERRHNNEVRFVNECKLPYLYAILSHNAVASKSTDWHSLLKCIAEGKIELKLLTLSDLSEIVMGIPVSLLNKNLTRNSGSIRTGYAGRGWRVKYKQISPARTLEHRVTVDSISFDLKILPTARADNILDLH